MKKSVLPARARQAATSQSASIAPFHRFMCSRADRASHGSSPASQTSMRREGQEVLSMTTNWGDRNTAENRAGTQLTICVHLLLMQLQRLVRPRHDFDIEAVFDPVLDAILYAYALRQTVQVAEMCRAFNPGKIGRAVKDFENAVPDYKNVRDVLAHFDRYEVGKGNLDDVNKALADSVHFIDYDPNAQVVRIGALSLDIPASYSAANVMITTIRRVLTPTAFPEA
jgi:hypothetical protein